MEVQCVKDSVQVCVMCTQHPFIVRLRPTVCVCLVCVCSSQIILWRLSTQLSVDIHDVQPGEHMKKYMSFTTTVLPSHVSHIQVPGKCELDSPIMPVNVNLIRPSCQIPHY